jgi:hypothetical protein
MDVIHTELSLLGTTYADFDVLPWCQELNAFVFHYKHGFPPSSRKIIYT